MITQDYSLKKESDSGDSLISVICVLGIMAIAIALIDNFIRTDKVVTPPPATVEEDPPAPSASPAPPSEPFDWQPLAYIGIGLIVLAALFALAYFGGKKVREIRIAQHEEKQKLLSMRNEWSILEERYTKASKTISSYETDLLLALRYPAMNDVLDSTTSDMINSLKKAKDTQRLKTNNLDEKLLQRFAEDVYSLEVNLERAVKNAKKIAWDHIGAEDKKDFAQAERLFKHATDKANPAEARNTYMEQLEKVIQRINKRNRVAIVPQASIAAIEEQIRPQLEIHKG